MEHEMMLTGIGGQSVQLAAQILARACVLDNRQVTYLGTYGGTMRGGNTDATLIISDQPVSAPPLVSELAGALAMHHQFFQPLREKLRPNALIVLNESLFEGEAAPGDQRVFPIPATQVATDLGNPLAASMVLVAAYACITELACLASLIAGMREAIPPYRRQHLESNEKALHLGFEQAPAGAASVWAAGEPA